MSDIKSILSIFLIFLTLSAMFTMFEVFGRTENKFNIEKLKKIHLISGRLYVLLYLVLAYFGLDAIVNIKAGREELSPSSAFHMMMIHDPNARVIREELSPSSAFHTVFALTIITLLLLKVSFIRIYRQFYDQAKTIGLLIALITFVMAGTSAGFHLIATMFGTELHPAQRAAVEKMTVKNGIIVRTDMESIEKGKGLYDSKCLFCHDPRSAEWIVGPGLKNIMKNPMLPVSKRPATPENIMEQIINPYRNMPSFAYMSEDEILNLIAYLNTL